jgi:hypothetical protein
VRIRPLAAAAAAALVLGIAGPAAASTAATTAKPAAGTATSAVTLLSLALAGHDVRVGTVALRSDTVSGSPAAKVVVTPVRADGKAYGEQTVTPADSPASVPSFDSSATLPAALRTVASVKSPVFSVSSSTASGASSKAGAASLGSVSVLGLPVKLDGTVDVTSLVNGQNALGEKTVAVKNLALPSIADLLAALGLDLSKLPVKTLTDLLAGLSLTDTAVTAAQKALTDAEAALGTVFTDAQKAADDANATVKTRLAEVAKDTAAADQALQALQQANSAVGAATAKRDAADAALSTALAQLPASVVASVPTANTAAGYAALTPAQRSTVESGAPGTAATAAAATDAANALASAQSTAAAAAAASAAADAALAAAKTALAAAQAALATAVAALKALLAQLAPQINALLAAVTAVLDRTPLVSIDSFTVQTQAVATTASAGGQAAKVVGGEIQGVHVLGTDVLKNVLGNSSINVLDLTGSTLSQVTSKVSALTGVLSSVLSAVPGLSIPTPTVQLLTKSTSTGIAGGFGTAQNTVKALSISIPAITLPAALALPGAASLPAISGAPNLKGALGITAVGDLVSKSMTISVGTLSEQASFRPAVAGGPGTVGGPPLATTGLPAGIAVLGLLLLGAGLAVRRRLMTQA